MFAIAVPSTIRLTTSPEREDGEPLDYATLDFFHPDADVSKCRLRLTTADGAVHEATFNTNGGVVDRYYASAEDMAKQREEQEKAEEARAERDRVVADEANAKELKTADDTTTDDVAWDAPHEHDPLREPDRRTPTPPPNPFAGNTGVTGGPDVLRETQPHGVVNTTRSMREPPKFDPQTGQPNPLYHPEPG